MELEVRFFATFRDAVGTKTITWTADDEATVGDILTDLEAEYADLEGQLLEDGAVRPQVNVLADGRNVEHEDGVETGLSAVDQVSVFPPVAGG